MSIRWTVRGFLILVLLGLLPHGRSYADERLIQVPDIWIERGVVIPDGDYFFQGPEGWCAYVSNDYGINVNYDNVYACVKNDALVPLTVGCSPISSIEIQNGSVVAVALYVNRTTPEDLANGHCFKHAYFDPELISFGGTLYSETWLSRC